MPDRCISVIAHYYTDTSMKPNRNDTVRQQEAAAQADPLEAERHFQRAVDEIGAVAQVVEVAIAKVGDIGLEVKGVQQAAEAFQV